VSRIAAALAAARESWRYTSPAAVRAREIEEHRRELRARSNVAALLQASRVQSDEVARLESNVGEVEGILRDLVDLGPVEGVAATDALLGRGQP